MARKTNLAVLLVVSSPIKQARTCWLLVVCWHGTSRAKPFSSSMRATTDITRHWFWCPEKSAFLASHLWPPIVYMYYCRDLGGQNQFSSFLWRTPKLSAIIAPSPSRTGMSNLRAACMPTVASAHVFCFFRVGIGWIMIIMLVVRILGNSSLNVYVYSLHHHIWPCHFLKLPLWWLQVIFRLCWSTLHPTHLKLQSIPLVFAINLVEVFRQIFLHFPRCNWAHSTLYFHMYK